MKKIIFSLAFASFFILPSKSFAYIGFGIGAVDKSHFGYGLDFGGGLPLDLGLDMQIVGYTEKDSAGIRTTWIQGNADLTYDFQALMKKVIEKIELHPYVKGGFTYGAGLLKGGIITNTQASHGPGFNFGGGLDWKIFPSLTLGVDLTESIISLDGVTVSGVKLSPNSTDNVFNFLVILKFFAY